MRRDASSTVAMRSGKGSIAKRGVHVGWTLSLREEHESCMCMGILGGRQSVLKAELDLGRPCVLCSGPSHDDYP